MAWPTSLSRTTMRTTTTRLISHYKYQSVRELRRELSTRKASAAVGPLTTTMDKAHVWLTIFFRKNNVRICAYVMCLRFDGVQWPGSNSSGNSGGGGGVDLPNFARFMHGNKRWQYWQSRAVYRDYRKQSMKGDALADFRAKKRNWTAKKERVSPNKNRKFIWVETKEKSRWIPTNFWGY